ncbi:hypothetical protein N9B31_09680 [Mariniblastus sp.]|nr:hypothetical protein [bacterium]MDA7903918.1 hypothetical protein [Mariniblastus sp.]MDA7885178.1 hypothetical protein [bacterium]MDA7901546.1 hypothetical protein [bacterium]MDA7904519.1 hypothetical protein [bacterium]
MCGHETPLQTNQVPTHPCTIIGGRLTVQSAMEGFLKGHSRELERDQDGFLTRREAVGKAERMFAKMDRNGDRKIMPGEIEASRHK